MLLPFCLGLKSLLLLFIDVLDGIVSFPFGFGEEVGSEKLGHAFDGGVEFADAVEGDAVAGKLVGQDNTPDAWEQPLNELVIVVIVSGAHA